MRRRWGRIGAAVALGLLVVGALPMFVTPPATAASRQNPPSGPSATSADVRRLASDALHDPGALARLRQIRVVDGRPVDLAGALDALDVRDLQARLRALAGGSGAGGSSVEARRSAEAVLAQSRFHSHEPPRPLRGVLRSIGGFFERVFRPVGGFLDRIISPRWRMPLLGLALALVAAALGTYFVRRRSRAAVERHRRLAGLVEEAADPRDLERRADAAESSGRYRDAVRLRFLAGLLRLDRAGVVEVRTSETTGQLRAALGSADFDSLAVTFDEVVYGNRAATATDVSAARAAWSRVLERRPEPVDALR